MDPVKNFGYVTVSTGYDASATSIVLSSGHGAKLPDPVVDGPYNLIWYDSTNYPNPADDPNVEIIRVTARSSDTLTVTRSAESTSATTKNTADAIYKMFLGSTAKTITDMEGYSVVKVAGAVGDADTINNAIGYVGYGHLIVKGTSAIIDKTITVPSNFTLEFVLENGITVPSSHNLTQYTQYTDVYSPLITNDDHSSGNTNIQIIGAMIDFDGDNGKSLNQSWAGIWLHNVTDSYVKHCDVYDVVYNVNWTYGRGFGILISDSSKSSVLYSKGRHCGYEGIGIRSNCDNIIVYNCEGWNNRQHSMQVAGWSPSDTTDYSEQILIDSCKGDGNILVHGGNGENRISFCNNMCGYVGVIENVADVVINNNIVKRIYMNSTANQDATIENIQIINNQINDPANTDSAIKIYTLGTGTKTIKNVLIGNNICTTGIFGNAINLLTGNATTDISDIFIVDNIAHTRRVMSIGGAGAGTIRKIHLNNNTFDPNHAEGIIIKQADLCIATDFYINGNSFNDSLWPAAGTVDRVLLIGNDFSECSNLDDWESWTNLTFRDNVGYVSQNSGSSTGTGAEQTIVHGLNKTPLKVILWNIENGANPYTSAASDGTNIYITAVNGNDYGWEASF